ncbi:phosphorylase family protein, partial [Francisella tularensis]|uniref:phosphorylase family protein n=1 Tax=Francisella tularensis TaxID=263 RepID=UPI0023AE26E7|nr:5'-methylthioadenosine/adenosylhomocysteine nucleosidase [Francisella tularensis subsp. holarctica]
IEIIPILAKLDNDETIEYAKNKYKLANYQDKELVLAYSKIGKVFSSLTATIMIERFGVEALLFSGVAGGLQELKVGDMIA